MGLAASQARLLTITSRLSSVELRQQRIAMDKMRLASDQQGVSDKYTKALNNKTLSFSNGTNTIPMSYTTLVSQGYSVARASDGLVPKSGAGYTGEVVEKPTCKRPEEIEKPAILEKPLGTKTEVIGGTQELSVYDYLMSALNEFKSVNYWKTENGTPVNTYGMTNEEKKEAGVTVKDYWSDVKEMKEIWTSKVIPAFNNAITQLEVAGKTDLAKNLTSLINSQTQLINEERSEPRSEYDSGNTTMQAVKRHGVVCSNRLFDSKDIYSSVTVIADAQVEKDVPTYTPEQEQAYTNWMKEVNQAEEAWNEYDNYLKAVNSASGASSDQVDFYNQLQNSQFLIQGLLSGYLTLMKDGKEVSLSSATDILEDYDKTDDAAAEAEYNSQMAKINKKEKMLDMQAKRIDTEYSALSTEYESIRNIINQHTSKDFSYFT